MPRNAAFGLLMVGMLALGATAHADSPPADTPVVKLLSPGAAPQKALRLTAKTGYRQTVVMAMGMAMGIQAGGKDVVPMTYVPEVRMTLSSTVASVSPEGDMRCTFTIGKAELASDPNANPQIVAAMKKSLSGLDNITGYAVITNRGFTKEADLTVGDNVDPQLKQLLDGMRQSLHQLAAPMPAEPVGKGARWQTTMKPEMNGIRLDQVAVYELVEMSKSSIKLTVTMEQHAGQQKVTRDGLTFELISLESKGSGDMSFDLAQLIAAPAALAMKSAMQMEAMGQKMDMKIDMKIDMKLGVKRK